MDAFSFHDTLKEFDRYLNRTYLETLSLDEARLLLARIETFNALAKSHHRTSALHPERESVMDEYMVTAGCRLASDLSEKIMMRLVDLLQERDDEITLLSSRLRQKLQERYEASTLLSRAQTARANTNHLGETHGLGVIL